ncbi:hypothetical protein HPB48_012801 [Haemaphysalis longicornis]|uniref:HAT C-terminal dimerisation domain-containing protein n=1 Tax=Haemaphysalis longicornis TaxID=44386 RepID=A0A9J6FX44_HAELO|nr:hypothetical protein HPB48_012801 [Haemaphysalis longicornis]
MAREISEIKVEWKIWKQKRQATPPEELPGYATEAIKQCNASLFPNIGTLVKILATPAVTTAAAERSFSMLKCLKAYFCNSFVEQWLNGLAVMSLHRKSIDMRNVIASFMMKARRFVF